MHRPAHRPQSVALGPSAGVSLALHGGLILLAWLALRSDEASLPPVYRINLVAAPAGPRSVGQVQPADAPSPPPTPAAPVPKSVETAPRNPVRTAEPARRPPPAASTQVPNATRPKPGAPVPKAGGGATGGTGTDVANVATGGIAFPFPGYLQNIANQILMNFEWTDPRPFVADIAFQVHRDGRVTEIEVRRSSGNKLFDIAARGAVEAAARSRAFGPLPDGFNDDVLPVIFTFTPQMIR